MYWWVNQGQSYKEEIKDNYIWSPKTEKGGRKSTGYDNMTFVEPGDVIFSYAKGKIQAIGTATSSASEAVDPHTLQGSTKNWGTFGWKVQVAWNQLEEPTRTKEFIAKNNFLLPQTYSPVLANGNGKQKIYLSEIQTQFAHALFKLCNLDPILSHNYKDTANNAPTEVEQTVLARRKQHIFRKNLLTIEDRCRVTGVREEEFLIASHIKPWSQTINNTEKLDPYNGLLFSPHIDKLFDGGWISFTDSGDLLIATKKTEAALKQWQISHTTNIGTIHPNRQKYLAYHRKHIFKAKQ